MQIIKKLQLYFSIKKFYKIFGLDNFITKLSDMTYNNLNDVIYDINEILCGYDNDEMCLWLDKLCDNVAWLRDKEPATLNSILFNICNTKKNGYYELRPFTRPIYKFAQWLYKKGVI